MYCVTTTADLNNDPFQVKILKNIGHAFVKLG